MLKIAICDDLSQEREIIKNILTEIQIKWEVDFTIKCFSSGEELIAKIKNEFFDVILLDIVMNGIDGIETATTIRTFGESSLIIFVSCTDDRIRELFDIRTIGFIDKPIKTETFEALLKKALKIVSSEKSVFFTFNKNGFLKSIPLSEIIYFESSRNEIIIHTTRNELRYYDTLSALWERIKDLNIFILPSRTYIFNMNFISVKSKKIIFEKNGEIFNIGEKYKSDTQERYLNFIEKRWIY